MTDRELLEAAAKAAGYIVARWSDDDAGILLAGHQDPWNPLQDDGDALRLAATLGERNPCFVLGTFTRTACPYVSASLVLRDGTESYIEQDIGGDVVAATRRAIVRAAAALASSSQAPG